MIHLSDRDCAMIEVMRRSGRISVTELADTLGVSRSTAQKRLERLEGSGVIESYTCVVAAEYRQGWVKAHVLVTVAPKMMDPVVAHLSNVSGIEEAHSVSGDIDLIVVITAPTVQKIEASVDEIITVPGVERTRTSIILSTRINRHVGGGVLHMAPHEQDA